MRHVLRWDELAVGRRVVVRHRLPDGSASDALGELVAADGERLVVATRRGEVVVPRTAVLAGKAVPPAARRTTDLAPEQLELVAAEHWRPHERVDLGDWRLRASGGFTHRANSVLAVGSPGVGLDDALAQVVRFYGERGLPPVVVLPGPSDRSSAALGPQLAARGWTSRLPTVVMTAAVGDLLGPQLDVRLDVRLDGEPDEGWLGRYQARGEVGAGGRRVLLSADEQVFASVRTPDQRVVGVARGSLSRAPHGRWLGLAAVETDPAHRRQGLATRLSAAVAAWGAQRGARQAFLQVAAANEGARALYERLGFAVHHGYEHWDAPPRDPEEGTGGNR